MKLWTKIIAGAESRKTRLHDATGARVSMSRLLRNGPRALASAVGRAAFGLRPERPWISYDAAAELARRIGPATRALEFGSGMSTLWLAQRVGLLVSVEDHAGWHALVSRKLGAAVEKVEYRLATKREDYLAAADGREFDLILVDGKWRGDCVAVGLEHIAPGGILYLDNADHGAGGSAGDVPQGVALMEEAARTNGWRLTRFTDFAPTSFFAQAALMLERPKD